MSVICYQCATCYQTIKEYFYLRSTSNDILFTCSPFSGTHILVGTFSLTLLHDKCVHITDFSFVIITSNYVIIYLRNCINLC